MRRHLFSKLRGWGLLGGVALASAVLVSAVLVSVLMNTKQTGFSPTKQHTPQSIALWQLKKDVQREAVPVTGKTKNLRPPPPGEHVH